MAAFDDFYSKSGQPTCSSSRAIRTNCYITEGGYPTANSCHVPFEYHTKSFYYPKHFRYGSSYDSLESKWKRKMQTFFLLISLNGFCL